MRLASDGHTILLSTWDAVRALYAWTTTLTHALISGATGNSLVDRLAWYPPPLLGGPRPDWPEELGHRQYRVRLRLDSDQERATAAQVVLHALDPLVRAATDRLRLSLSTPTAAAVRWPDTSLPVSGAVEIQFQPGPHPDIPMAGALCGMRWDPPFDGIEFVVPGSTYVGSRDAEPDHPTTSNTVQSLDDKVARREKATGRRVTVSAPFASISDRFVARVTPVPKSTSQTRHGPIRYTTSAVGSVAAGGLHGGGVVSRGVTTQGLAQTSDQLPPSNASSFDLAGIVTYVADDLEEECRQRGLPWGAVDARLRAIARIEDLAAAKAGSVLGKRLITCVEIGIDEWGLVAVDVERCAGDPSRYLHALGLVRSARAGSLPSNAEIAQALLQRAGCIPKSDRRAVAGLVWHPVRHPVAGSDAAERQTVLRRILVRHVRNVWMADHARRP